MNDRTVGRIAVALAGILVLVVGLIFVTRGSGTGSAASPLPSASVAASSSSGSPSAGPNDATQPASASAAASASGEASSSASAGVVPATFTVVGLKLDATDDPAGQARIISFKSEQPGTIIISLTSITPQGTTHMCLSQGTKEVGCKDWAKGTFTRTTKQSNVTWTVTVIGNDIETPVVNVEATFPAETPSVMIEHARFDGTDSPETNGITVAIQARGAGSLGLLASWDGSFAYEVAVVNGATGTTDVSGNTVPSTGIDSPSIAVEAGAYRLSLTNTDTGTGAATDLTASVGWP